jgi:hypothetical protein
MDLTMRLKSLLDDGGRPSHAALLGLYDDAEPIDIAFLLGDWAGHAFGTDAPEEKLLASIRWVGKNFRAADDVDPIVCLDDAGERTANPVAGTAHLEMLVHRGAETATMVYEAQPMRDHFRRIDDKTVLGAMEKDGAKGPGFFYLTRL